MNPKKGAVIVPIVLFAAIIFMLIAYFINYTAPDESIPSTNDLNIAPEFTNNPPKEIFKSDEKYSLTGIVYTSGLTYEERGILGAFSDFQLEKTPLSEGWPEGKIFGVYLEPNEMNFQKYLGQCIFLEGNIKKGWEDLDDKNFEINGKWTYNRSVIIVDKTELRNIRDCLDDFDHTITSKEIIKTLEEKTLKGILRFTDSRPAPDISYDLEIKLNEPFIDEQSASGKPYLVTIQDVSALTDEIHIQMLESIGKEVEIEGYMEWGFAESRFFRITSLSVI